jgi:ATP-dependent Clp protease adapter protein ClpS
MLYFSQLVIKVILVSFVRCLLSDVFCLMSFVRCLLSDVFCQVVNRK